MSINRMMQMVAGGGEPIGAWDLDYAYYDDPGFWNVTTARAIFGYNVSGQDTVPYAVAFKPDGTRMYVVGNTGDAIYQYDLSTAWRETTATYIGSFGLPDITPTGVFFKPDGTRMYVSGDGSDRVYEFSLSTAWDVSTASQVTQLSISTQENLIQDVFLSPDGTRMYIIGETADKIHQYSLSTAWDLSTASLVQNIIVSAQEAQPQGLFFKPDGARMYVIGRGGDEVNEYSLSTPWDISTATHVRLFYVGGDEATPTSVFFKPDGSKMFMVGYTYDIVRSYLLGGFDVVNQETTPTGLYFKPDGTVMYVVGSAADAVHQYSLSTAWDTSTASFVQSFSIAGQELLSTGIFFKPDGTKMYISGNTGDDISEYSLSTAWDVSTSTYLGRFSVNTQDSSPTDLYIREDGLKMYVVGGTTDSIYEYSLSTAWDTTTASYVRGFSVAAQEASPVGLFFKPDGLKMYVIGAASDNVLEYDLSTAWNISTATLSKSISVYDQDVSMASLAFKPDGTKMFALGGSSRKVYTFTLGPQ